MNQRRITIFLAKESRRYPEARLSPKIDQINGLRLKEITERQRAPFHPYVQ